MDNGIYHDGHSGWTTQDILGSIENWIRDAKPDVVSLMIGTNDIWRGMYQEQAIKNIQTIANRNQQLQPTAVIFISNVLPMDVNEGKEDAGFNANLFKVFASRIASGERIVLVDSFTGFNPKTDSYDSVHPNDEGYVKMGNVWHKYLKANYKEKFPSNQPG